jgi:hypothetical protein
MAQWEVRLTPGADKPSRIIEADRLGFDEGNTTAKFILNDQIVAIVVLTPSMTITKAK